MAGFLARLTMKLSLESRLNLSIAFIMLLIIGLGFGWAILDARKSVSREAGASVELALGLIDAARLAGELKPSALHGWVEKISHLDRIRHLRIAVTSNDSLPPVVRAIEDQARPNDGVPDWFRWAVVTEPLVIVREVSFGPTQSLFIRIDSYAEDEVREAWEETQGFLMLQGLLLIAIYGAVHFLAGRALRPVGRILKGLNAMEEGDYETRLPHFGLSELDQISAGINHLSSSLNASREENRALTRHSLSIQEEERRSIAQEIHDEFGQSLTAIKMMSGAMLSNPNTGALAVQEIQKLCDRLFDVVRSLMRRLRPMVLEDLGLKAAISDLRDHLQITSPHLEILFSCDASLDELRGEISLEIYRILQEALTNTLRHSEGTQSEISIVDRRPNTIHLMIKDNGRGMASSVERRGFGLLGMRERVASLKGVFNLINRPGEGLEIRIVLPLQDV